MPLSVCFGASILNHRQTFPANAETVAEDPSSSSYELPAIDDDGRTQIGAFAAEDLAGERDRERIDRRESGMELLEQPVPLSTDTAHRAETARAPSPAVDAARALGARAGEPWQMRLLQLWGIILLLWAAFIVARDLLSMTPESQASSPGGRLTQAVLSVLLLVAGAAGLFLAVEYGRSLCAGRRIPRECASQLRPAFPLGIRNRLRQSLRPGQRKAEPIHS